MIEAITDQLWMVDAECKDTDTRYFFGLQGEGALGRSTENDRLLKMGKEICTYCVVQVECLEWALQTNSLSGTFGGLTDRERKKHRHRIKKHYNDPTLR